MQNILYYLGWHIPHVPVKLSNAPLGKWPKKNQAWPFIAKAGDTSPRYIPDYQCARKLNHSVLDFGLICSTTQGTFKKRFYSRKLVGRAAREQYILDYCSLINLYTFSKTLISFCQYYPRLRDCKLYRGKAAVLEPAEIYFDAQTRLVVVLAQTTGEFITAYRFSVDDFNILMNERVLAMGCPLPPRFYDDLQNFYYNSEKDTRNMDFNKYSSLLKEINESSVKKVFQNNPSTYKEFLEFEDFLKEEVYFESREEYFSLIRNFVKDEQMSYEEFTDRFYDIYERDEAKIEDLKNDLNALSSIQFVNRPFKVTNLLAGIFGSYDYITDFSETEDIPTSVSEFRGCILLFSKTLPEE